MDLLLLFIGLILLGQQSIYFLGLTKVKGLMTPANLVQGIIPVSILVFALIFQSWYLLIAAFLVERCWIMVELGVNAKKREKRLHPFFYLQLLSFVIGILVLFTQTWWVFAWLYLAVWLISFLQWRKRVQHISH